MTLRISYDIWTTHSFKHFPEKADFVIVRSVSKISSQSPPAEGPRAVPQALTSRWVLIFVFFAGWSIQFNLLIGGGGDVTATGGFGFRLTDFLMVGAVGLLALKALEPRYIPSILLFGIIAIAVALLRAVDPLFWIDTRTQILFLHYVAYSFAGLYLATLIRTPAAIDKFCWGLIIGMLMTVPIFVLQDLGYNSTLVELGLVPPYFRELLYENSDLVRYSGLWGHPNEASHVAALSAAAGAYLQFSGRNRIAFALTAIGLLIIFHYTQSRGGLLASGAVLAVPLIFGSTKKISVLRIFVGIGIIAIGALALSQIDVIAYRFTDSESASNFNERIGSTLAAIQMVLSSPLGMPDAYFESVLTLNAGVNSPHNGFIFFAAIFGWVPLLILVAVFISNLRRWTDCDAFFALLTLQMCVSFMFEQMPLSYCYALVICLLASRAYLRTRLGRELINRSVVVESGRFVASHREVRRSSQQTIT
jgi:hypothetical protein